MNRCTKCGYHNHTKAQRCGNCKAFPVLVPMLVGNMVIWKYPTSRPANQPVGWNGN